MADVEKTSRTPQRVDDENPPPGILHDSSLVAYVAESVAEVGISLIPLVGAPITMAYDKARARKDAQAQHRTDLFLYRLDLSLQDQLDRLGQQVEALAARLADPAVQDLVGQGVDASVDKTDSQISQIADAVGRVIASGEDVEDVPALLEIVSGLRDGDVTVLRALVTEVMPGDTRSIDDIAARCGVSEMRTHVSLLRLDAADLVNRFTDSAGVSNWTPTKLGVRVAVAMGETAARALPDGWTQADADLLTTLLACDAENPAAIPTLNDLAERTGRAVADLDASAQVLDSAGYAERHMTLNGTPYAYSAILDDSAYLWQAKQDETGFEKVFENIMQLLRALPDGQIAGSAQVAAELELHPKLTQTIFRRLATAGFVKGMSDSGMGPLYVTPTEKLRRTSPTDYSSESAAGA